ncbi:hypothetical protein PM082_009256 [Marasmius tenuissimus]|nr:hypothetical protein PM082_009256 [Marasmius tenuissimus]
MRSTSARASSSWISSAQRHGRKEPNFVRSIPRATRDVASTNEGYVYDKNATYGYVIVTRSRKELNGSPYEEWVVLERRVILSTTDEGNCRPSGGPPYSNLFVLAGGSNIAKGGCVQSKGFCSRQSVSILSERSTNVDECIQQHRYPSSFGAPKSSGDQEQDDLDLSRRTLDTSYSHRSASWMCPSSTGPSIHPA